MGFNSGFKGLIERVAAYTAKHNGHTNILCVQKAVSGWYYNSSCALKG